MTPANPQEIYQDEIWQKSNCLEHERKLEESIWQILCNNNWQEIVRVGTKTIWQRDAQQVVVSLVDDFQNIVPDRSRPLPRAFPTNTLVVTDNYISCPTNYDVFSTPSSFFGIYSYTTKHLWCPQRDFTFGVNRMDFKRIQLLLQLDQTLSIEHGYVNFNCVEAWDRHSADASTRFCDYLKHCANNQEHRQLQILSKRMPLCNYTETHEEIYTKSWLNIVIETYSSDYVASISEKLMRCLVTPAPWIAFAGCHALSYLESLGFDILADVVDHRYDSLREAQHKLSNFAACAVNTIASLKMQNFPQLAQRCQAAADHNTVLLAQLNQQWETGSVAWLDQLAARVK